MHEYFLIGACDLCLYCHFITLKCVCIHVITCGHTQVHITLTSDLHKYMSIVLNF